MPILDKNDKNKCLEFETFVQKSPYGHCMQSMNWAKVKDNWESDYVYLEDDNGTINATLSILSVKNDGVHSFMYAPRGPICDLRDVDKINNLLKEAEKIVKKNNGFLLRLDPEVAYEADLVDLLKSNIDHDNLFFRTRGADEHSFSNPRHNMIFKINGRNFDEIMADFKSSTRNKIKKTYKNGLETRRIRRNDAEFESAIDTFFNLIKIMAARQGITHRPKSYFLRLFDAFDDVVLYETYDFEEVLSSCIVVNYNHKAFYMYAASSDNKRNLRASLQMNLEAIKDTAEKGIAEYDLGGVFVFDQTDGLYSFKSGITGDEGLSEFIGEIDLIYDDDLYEGFVNK